MAHTPFTQSEIHARHVIDEQMRRAGGPHVPTPRRRHQLAQRLRRVADLVDG